MVQSSRPVLAIIEEWFVWNQILITISSLIYSTYEYGGTFWTHRQRSNFHRCQQIISNKAIKITRWRITVNNFHQEIDYWPFDDKEEMIESPVVDVVRLWSEVLVEQFY